MVRHGLLSAGRTLRAACLLLLRLRSRPSAWGGLTVAAALVAVAAVALADPSATTPSAAYDAAVAADHPVALLTFADARAATTLHDSAGAFDAENDGVVTGADGPFRGATAATFAGDARATLGANPLASATSFTVEAWVRLDDTDAGDAPAAELGDDSGAHLLLTARDGGSGHVRLSLAAGGESAAVDGPALGDTAWHDVVATGVDGTLRLYVDGEPAGSRDGVTLTPASVGAAAGTIGAAGSATLHGALGELAFYATALSADRIRAHYDAAQRPFAATAPAIAGMPQVGSAATADPGTWLGVSPIGFDYRWQRCDAAAARCADVPGATGTTYTPAPEDAGATLRVAVTAHNAAGSADATSAATAPVERAAVAQQPSALQPSTTTQPVGPSLPKPKTLTKQSAAWSASSVSSDPACTVTWDGGGDGSSWSDAANWSGDAVPTTSDVACAGDSTDIHVTGTAVAARLLDDGTLEQSGGNLNISPGSLGTAADNPSSIATLTVSGGTFTGSALVHVTDALTWTNGGIEGAGELVVDSGATARFTTCPSGCQLWTTRAQITNQGSLSVPSGTVVLAGGPLVNDGTVRVGGSTTDAATITSFGGGSITNASGGTLRGDGGTGHVEVGAPVDNDGTVLAAAGTELDLTGGVPSGSTSSGTWTTDGSGSVHFVNGTQVLSGATLDGSISITGGAVTASGAVAQSGTLTLAGGTLNGAGTISIADSFRWTGGGLEGTGDLVVAATATATFTTCSGSCQLWTSQRRIVNHGALSIPSGGVMLGYQSSIVNDGTVRVGSDGTDVAGLGASSSSGFVNSAAGTLLADSGAGHVQVDAPVDNDGVVRAASGTTLRLTGGGFNTQGGTWSGVGSGKVVFAGGSDVLAGAALRGAVRNEGTGFQLAGPVDQSGVFEYAGGDINGAGALNVDGEMDWTGGALQGSGATTISVNGTLDVDQCTGCGAGDYSRPLVNHGTINITSGQLYMNGSGLTNDGLIRVYGNAGASPSIQSSGAIIQSTGTVEAVGSAPVQISIPFENEGTVRADDTTLDLEQGGVGTIAEHGTFTTTGTGLLRFRDSTHLLAAATLSGSIEITGTVQTVGTVTQTGHLLLSAGQLSGNGELDVNGDMDWTDGAMQGSGPVVIATGSHLTITTCASCGVYDGGRTLVGRGQIRLDGGLTLDHHAVLDNQSTLIAESGFTQVAGGDGAWIHNAGTFKFDAAATDAHVDAPIDNEGIVNVEGRIAAFRSGLANTSLGVTGSPFDPSFGASTGTWETDATGMVRFSDTPITFTSTTTWSGNITLATTVHAPYLGSGARHATLTMNGPAQFYPGPDVDLEGFHFDGGDLLLSGRFTPHLGIDWTDGAMEWVGAPVDSNTKGFELPVGSVSRMHEPDGGFSLINGVPISSLGSFRVDYGQIWLRNGAVFSNGGLFEMVGDSASHTGFLADWPGYGVIYNSGTFKAVGGYAVGIQPMFVDTGRKDGPLLFSDYILIGEGPGAHSRGPANQAEPGIQRSCAGDPVNCATGNMYESQTDVAVPGLGLGLDFTRTYNAQATADGGATAGTMGYGWTTSYSDHLLFDPAGGHITVVQADGSGEDFVAPNSGAYWFAAPWVHATLTRAADGTYRYTLPSGVVYAFGSDGRLLWQSDRDGNHTTPSYDGSGRMTSVTDAGGRSLRFAYNGDGTTASVTDPAGAEIDYTYSGGDLAGVARAGVSGAAQWVFGYDGTHQMTSLTDANGHTTTTGYDASHRVVTQTDAASRTRTWDYDGDTTTITNPGGDVTREVFENGEPASVTRAYGTAKAATTTIEYDVFRQAIETTDPNGKSTSYTYDDDGNRTSVTDADGHTSRWTYDDQHDVLTASSPMGKTDTYVYDADGNVTSATSGTGVDAVTTTYGYDTAGQLTSATDALSHTTTYDHDGYGNRTSQTTPSGKTTRYGYDEDSRLTSITSPRGKVTRITRDAFGRATIIKDPNNKETTTAYDRAGDVTDTTDATGVHTHITYDAVDEPTHVVSGAGADQRTTYDANGQIVTQTDADDQTTTYTRDVLERVTGTEDPLGRDSSAEYDTGGRLTSTTDNAGHVADFGYDDAGQLTSITHVGDASADVTYAYNADGQRTSMTDATGETTYGYDPLGRLSSVVDGHGDEVAYDHDANGDQTGVTYPGGDEVTRSYDEDGRLASVADWLGHTTTVGYDDDSDRTSIAFPSSTGDVDTRSYDDAGNVTSIAMRQGATTLASIGYTRDDAGRVGGTTQTGLPGGAGVSYDRDSAGRLSSVATSAYAYDGAGQPTALGTTTGMTYDDGGQLTHAVIGGIGTDYTFNSLGERTGDGSSTYAYDRGGDLKTVTPGAGPVITYTYDGDGIRQTRTPAGGATTRFTWDSSSSVPLLLMAGGTSYVYDDSGLPLEQISAGGVVQYYHHDQLGNTRMLTDASGATTATFTYDVLGNRTGSTGSATTPLGYAGEYADPDTGLIYLRARDYDPVTGQFLTRDPLESSTHQPYAYGGGDPVDFTDPSGLIFGIPGTPSVGDIGMAISNTSASFLDGFTGGLSTQIAGKLLGFDADCAGYGGVAKYAGIVASFADGEGEAALGVRITEKVGASAEGGGLARVRGFLADESGHFSPLARIGRAPEYEGGYLTEGQALSAAERYLGEGYREVSPGRYVSADGARIIRYGDHEAGGRVHHIHFESSEGGYVTENTRGMITP